MRINWFSPLPPAMTEIAHYTARLVRPLSERVDVTLWTEQQEWDPALQGYAQVHTYDPSAMSWPEIHLSEATFYNIGNNAEFHLGIWQASRHHSGIVVLHDTCLQQFFAYCYRWLWNDLDGYLSVMEKYYGRAGRRDAELFWDDRLNTEYMVTHYPLTRLALENALAAVVHSRSAYLSLLEDPCCPVVWAPLPYAPSTKGRGSRGPENELHREAQEPYRLVLFGHIHENRRIPSIFEALAEFPQKLRFHLDIYGHIWNSKLVESLIQSYGLRDLVTIKGYVPEPELEAALDEADLAFNLRYPSVGEASASQLRIWDHALPSLVTPVGWYATIPDNVVGFVRVESEVQDIHAHLSSFLRDPQWFREMGKRGRKLLEERHSPSSYARAIEQIASAALLLKRRRAAFLVADRAADAASGWITSMGTDILVDRASVQIEHAFNPSCDVPPPFQADPEKQRGS